MKAEYREVISLLRKGYSIRLWHSFLIVQQIESGLHLKNIFKSGELDKDSVTEKNSATAADGKNYMTKFYNLDAIFVIQSATSEVITKSAITTIKLLILRCFQ